MSLYKPVFDKDLRYMIDQCKDMYQTMSTKNQVIKLGQFVADRMGGPVGRDEILNTFFLDNNNRCSIISGKYFRLISEKVKKINNLTFLTLIMKDPSIII